MVDAKGFIINTLVPLTLVSPVDAQGLEAHVAGLAGGEVEALLHRCQLDDIVGRIHFYQVCAAAPWNTACYVWPRLHVQHGLAEQHIRNTGRACLHTFMFHVCQQHSDCPRCWRVLPELPA